MPKALYLTKSKFKLGLECPRKLFYLSDKQYANQSLDDSFLKALANGGYQVGALAQQYYPHGVLISTLNIEDALKQTTEYLQQDNVWALSDNSYIFRGFSSKEDRPYDCGESNGWLGVLVNIKGIDLIIQFSKSKKVNILIATTQSTRDSLSRHE